MPAHAYTAAAISPRPFIRRAEGSGAASALALAGLCLLGLVLVWVLTALVPVFRVKDAVALYDFTLLDRPRIEGPAGFMLHLLDAPKLVLWGVALVAVALARERPRIALAVVAVMSLAPLTTEILKPLAAHPHVQVGFVHVGPVSWPSGHATAAGALVLSALLVAPARLRALVACVGGAFLLAVAVALLMLAWHMPSDVLAGYMVATMWAALAVAALRAADWRWPPRGGSGGRSPGGRSVRAGVP